jgi:hypothetical protein
MPKTDEAKKIAEAPKPSNDRSAAVPVLVRVTLADRLRIAALLAR